MIEIRLERRHLQEPDGEAEAPFGAVHLRLWQGRFQRRWLRWFFFSLLAFGVGSIGQLIRAATTFSKRQRFRCSEKVTPKTQNSRRVLFCVSKSVRIYRPEKGSAGSAQVRLDLRGSSLPPQLFGPPQKRVLEK